MFFFTQAISRNVSNNNLANCAGLVANGLVFIALAVFVGGCAVQLNTEGRPDSPIELREITDGVWLHTSYYQFPGGSVFPSNGLVVREDKALTLIDTAWGERNTIDLLYVIENDVGLPVTKAIVTHAHGDRLLGVDVLKEHRIEVFAHPMTQRLAVENGLPVPDRVFEGLDRPGDFIEIGSLEVVYPGPAHAPDNLVVWLPAMQALYGGCAVRTANARSAGNTSHADLPSWLAAIDLLQQRYATALLVVPGHGEPGDAALLEHTAKILEISVK